MNFAKRSFLSIAGHKSSHGFSKVSGYYMIEKFKKNIPNVSWNLENYPLLIQIYENNPSLSKFSKFYSLSSCATRVIFGNDLKIGGIFCGILRNSRARSASFVIIWNNMALSCIWVHLGKVLVDGQPLLKAGVRVSSKSVIDIIAEVPKYVCR